MLRLSVTIFCLATVVCAGRSLDDWLSPDDAVWHASASEWAATLARLGFQPVSGGQDAALRSTAKGLAILGLEIHEATIERQGDRFAGLSLSLYNRGDVGPISEAAFKELVNSALARLATHFGRQATATETRRSGNFMRVYLAEWRHGGGTTALLWSETLAQRRNREQTPYVAEYLTLKAVPAGVPATSVSCGAATARQRSLRDLLENLRGNERGDVWLDGLPMVDQGQKGYCAVATAERLFRYYGMDIDQHALAQIANTSATRGTSVEAMLDALRSSGARLGVRVRIHEQLDANGFGRLLTDYNRLARRAKRPLVEVDRRVLDVAAMYRAMEPALLLEARTRSPSAVDRFGTLVARHVDRGLPLVWSAMVGVYPEQPPVVGFGGHMRLVLGYNAQTNELLYSDSWGRGHELKRMPLDVAWAMTTGIYTFEPRMAH